MMMRNVFVFVFVLCCLATTAVCKVSAINNVSPANGAVVNDCPSFSWTSTDPPKNPRYILRVQNATGDIVFQSTTNTTSARIEPTDLKSLLSLGDYTWTVTSGSETSHMSTFSVEALSCIPESRNKIDNTLSDFYFLDKCHTDVCPDSWERRADISLMLNGKTVKFYPFDDLTKDESLLDMRTHESYPDSSMPKFEAYEATASYDLTSDLGDTLVAFRYVYYTTGNSTVLVECVDDKGNVQLLGCIGVSPNKSLQCEPDYVSSDGFHYNPSLEQAKWGFFKRVIAGYNRTQLTFRLRYLRAHRQYDDGIAEQFANYLFFASEFVFGQCSSLREGMFDSKTTSGDPSFDCVMCKSANRFIPLGYETHCADCSAHKQSYDECHSIEYCKCPGDPSSSEVPGSASSSVVPQRSSSSNSVHYLTSSSESGKKDSGLIALYITLLSVAGLALVGVVAFLIVYAYRRRVNSVDYVRYTPINDAES